MRARAAALAVIAVIALAAWLRLERLDLVEFKTDEGTNLRIAEDFVRLGRVPLVGMISSVGPASPPAFVISLVPVAALTRDPRAATAFVALVNVAAVAGVLALGWRFFSPLGGLVAGLAFAANPWAIFYARKVWQQDIIAPWTVLLIAALDRAMVARSVRWAVVSLPIFAIGVEIHFSFGVLAPLMLAPVAFLIGRRRWLHLGVGVGMALLTLLPYLVYLARTNWADLDIVRARLGVPALIDGDGPAFVVALASAWNQWYLVNVHLDRLVPGRIAATAATIQTLFLLLGVVAALVALFRPASTARAFRMRMVGLVAGLALPALLTVRHSVPLYEYYFLFVLPIAALLSGGGIFWLSHLPLAWTRPASVVAVAALLVGVAVDVFVVQRFLDRIGVEYESTYGPPLRATEAVADDLRAFVADAGSRRLVVELPGPESGALAYLVRPFVPSVDLATFGQVGLGNASPDSAIQRDWSDLQPPRPTELRYGDSVRVDSISASRRLLPGQRVHVALAWTSTGADPVWEIALLADGQEVSRQAGLQHPDTFEAGVPTVSWLRLETEPGAPPARYELRLRRLDPATGQPLTSQEWRAPLEYGPN